MAAAGVARASIVSKDIPEVIEDKLSKKEYFRGKFLGKGGFAKCYEVVDQNSKNVFACKILQKSLLVEPLYIQQVVQEIQIHKTLNHKHIVRFQSYFEDDSNIYIILELCSRRSLLEMLRRRRSLTEVEARYLLRQLLLACRYLREQRIIHRDLKLGNLFLNDMMELKVGDFGLSVRIEREDERRKTVCGTPNYIAPEILSEKGHSFEVDVWSIGCILYTMLVGRPPFQASNSKETYARIEESRYSVPSTISSTARGLIQRMLQPEPENRPNIDAILKDDFFISAMTSRKAEVPAAEARLLSPNRPAKHREKHLKELRRLLRELLSSRPPVNNFKRPDEAEDPAFTPVFWISKWVDFTEKCGMGYQLCDSSVGVLFGDNTCLILLNNNVNVTYVDKNGREHYHTLDKYPSSLERKIALLNDFSACMAKEVLRTGRDESHRECDYLIRPPFLWSCLRMPIAIFFYLTSGTVQVNFLRDNTKLIMCPLLGAVTYIDHASRFHTYSLSALKHGCPRILLSCLRYACTVLEKLETASTQEDNPDA